MRRTAFLLGSLAVASALAAPLPFAKPRKSDAQAIQGVWLLTRAYNSRGDRPLPDIQMRFTSDLMTFSCAGEQIATWAVNLDTKKSPREMSWRYVGGVSKGSIGQSITNIYRVEGDSLTIAWAEGKPGKPPTDFEGTKRGEWVNTYKRKASR
jgi:uncharacterized protein (TIGR03067 family)